MGAPPGQPSVALTRDPGRDTTWIDDHLVQLERSNPVPEAAVPTVVTLADVDPETVSWLWPGRLPAGKLVVIDGDPSTGKSTLTLDLAARVSAGSGWPDGSRCEPGDVLLLSAEDGLADTIAPRLAAAGADRERVHALTAVPRTDDDGTVRMVPPSLPADLPVIRGIVQLHQVRLVIVDVLMAYLGGKVDSHRDQDVRAVLHQLAALAEQTGCTIVLIRHLNKAGGSNALYRGGGSIGIVGAARAGYLVARDPDDPDRRILACSKLNIAVEPPSLAYRLVSVPEFGCARVEWEDQPTDHTAASLLRTPSDGGDEDERSELERWLLGYLSEEGGSVAAQEVIRSARAAGFNENQVKKARIRIGAKTERVGFGKGASWFWSIDSPIDAIDASPESPEPMAPMAAPMQPAPDTVRPQSAQLSEPGLTEPTEPPSDPTEPARDLLATARDACKCGADLSTATQRSRGICNRCWVAGRRTA